MLLLIRSRSHKYFQIFGAYAPLTYFRCPNLFEIDEFAHSFLSEIKPLRGRSHGEIVAYINHFQVLPQFLKIPYCSIFYSKLKRNRSHV